MIKIDIDRSSENYVSIEGQTIFRVKHDNGAKDEFVSVLLDDEGKHNLTNTISRTLEEFLKEGKGK